MSRVPADDPGAAPIIDIPGLRCMAASPRILKVLAHRIGEDEDDVLLRRTLGS